MAELELPIEEREDPRQFRCSSKRALPAIGERSDTRVSLNCRAAAAAEDERGLASGAMKHLDEFQKLWAQLVPEDGQAETQQGEMISSR